jgi:uncharacterized protein DUF2516
MEAFGALQTLLILALSVMALGVEIFALVDALRQRKDAFVAAGKLTKPIWLAILGVATAFGVIYLTPSFAPFPLLQIVSFVAAAVYLADVRPAVRGMTGGGRGNNGPYGPW